MSLPNTKWQKYFFSEFSLKTICGNSHLSQSELYGIDSEIDDSIQRQSSAETYDYMGD